MSSKIVEKKIWEVLLGELIGHKGVTCCPFHQDEALLTMFGYSDDSDWISFHDVLGSGWHLDGTELAVATCLS